MSDIRLEEIPFAFEGRTYLLRCNMNVLADVQEAFGGTISGALSGEKPTRSVMVFLAAMMNDYADDRGWPERYTARQLGRMLSPNMVPASDIMGLVARAVAPPKTAADENPAAAAIVSTEDTEDPGNPGN